MWKPNLSLSIRVSETSWEDEGVQSTSDMERVEFGCPTCGNRIVAVVGYRGEYRLGPVVYKDAERDIRNRLVCTKCGMSFMFKDRGPSGKEAARLVQVASQPAWDGWRLYGERFTVHVATYLKQRRRKGRMQQWLQTMAIFPSRLRVKPGEYLVELRSDRGILLNPIDESEGEHEPADWP